MDSIPKIESIVLIEEVKIQSVVEEKLYQKWVQEHIKQLPPKGVLPDQRKKAADKIKQIQQIKTYKNNLS